MTVASRKHKLMTKELERRFAKVGRQDIPDPLVITKFFNPYGPQTWFVTEYDPEARICFGFVMLNDPAFAELGDFSLDEIENCYVKVGAFDLPLERDCHWIEKPLSEAKRGIGL